MCLCVFVSLRECMCVYVQSLMNRPPVTPLFRAHSSSTSVNLQPMPHAHDQNNNKQNHVLSLSLSPPYPYRYLQLIENHGNNIFTIFIYS